MSHTPGPWIGTQPAGGFADIKDANGDLVFAICYPSLGMKDKCRPEEECEANFRLALAAPDLLEALENAVIILHTWQCISPDSVENAAALQQARAAIAKAKAVPGIEEKRR